MKKLKRALLLLTICFSTLLITGCDKYTVINDKKEASAAYWHEHNNYSVSIITDNRVLMYRLPYNVRVFTGAKTTWYMCKGKHRNWDGVASGSYCELHLQTIDDLSNASWNHGKFGSGMTTRIDNYWDLD